MITQFMQLIARHILTSHRLELPDLRRLTVLVPDKHVIPQLSQALSKASGLPALLLPQIITLDDWVETVTPETTPPSDTQRITQIYQALRERHWFEEADLWKLSRELLELMDELTRNRVALPESGEDFALLLTQAYRAHSGQAMQFEARVVHELWYVMAADNESDSVRNYQLRLAQLANRITTPLYILQTCDPDAPEARFLELCLNRVPVTIFDLRELARDAADCALLVSALQSDGEPVDLHEMATELRTLPESSLNGPEQENTNYYRRLRLIPAQGLEQEALNAERQIRRWLTGDRTSIAVVIQDRLVARRLRALLERSQILVRDETGWTYSTLSVSTALMRWLDVLQDDFYYLDVLDLLKSPFLFSGRKQAAWMFEQMVRKHGIVSHLEGFIQLAEREMPELISSLVRLRQAAHALPQHNHTLSEWLRALHHSLDILGVTSAWAQDAAGLQLLQLLDLWNDELKDKGLFSFSECRRWLAQQLDTHTFRDTAVESPVVFTHLAATRWRSFDAVLMLGCDAAHLPGPVNSGLWFNDAVRAALGLPLSNTLQLRARDDLLGLLAMNSRIVVTWQSNKNGEPKLLSPWFEMLRALHLLAFPEDRIQDSGFGEQDSVPVFPQFSILNPQSSVSIPQSAIRNPQSISPSGYNSLVACPYQYYARHILRLNELDEVREDLDKRDYGTWVHAVLQRFHTEIPLLQNHDRTEAEQTLHRLTLDVFAEALEHDYLAQAWLLRWQALIPAYLDWQLKNEQEGWRYQAAEVPFNIEITTDLFLKGRLDRIDKLLDTPDEMCVIDYKTQSIQPLKTKLKEPGEDVQLACYALALNATQAAFVSLESDKVASVIPPQDIVALAQQNKDRLITLFAQMRDGVPLPAHGASSVCGYCEIKGLCRRAYHQEGIYG